MAERAGLTKGFISQVERCLTSISVDSLAQILNVLDQELADFFSEPEKPKIVFAKSERRLINKPGIRGFELLIQGAQNRLMDPVICVLDPHEQTFTDDPHDGEEFGLILEERIAISWGEKECFAKKDDCFYFSSDRKHFIKNPGRGLAKFLWISSPPYF